MLVFVFMSLTRRKDFKVTLLPVHSQVIFSISPGIKSELHYFLPGKHFIISQFEQNDASICNSCKFIGHSSKWKTVTTRKMKCLYIKKKIATITKVVNPK